VLKQLLRNERGAITTVEVIGYTLLIAGAVALVGFGITALSRDKVNNTVDGVKAIRAMDDLIEGGSGTYTQTSDTNTGIVTEVNVN